MAAPPLHTKTIIIISILVLLCSDSFLGGADSAKLRGDKGMDGGEEVKLMRKLREEMDVLMDYNPPGANGKHGVPPPAGNGRP